jgi:hypothetical protein
MIKCLYGGCPKTFIDEEVKNFVSPEVFKKYRKFKISQMKLNNPDKNYVNCPHPDCEEILDVDVDGDAAQNEEEMLMECGYGHKFCARCKTEGWHKKKDCKNVSSGNKINI